MPEVSPYPRKMGEVSPQKMERWMIVLNKDITDADLPGILKWCGSMTNMINMSRCYNLTASGLEGLLTASDLKVLCWLKGLKGLDMSECPGMTGNLQFLTTMTKLTQLRMGFSNTLKDLGPVALLTNLVILDMRYCYGVTDITALRSLVHLRELNMIDCHEVKGDSFQAIADMKGLQKMKLSYCLITDDIIMFFVGLSNLRKLKLCGCDKITDAGAQSLTALKSLTSLNMSFCTKITDAGVQSLTALTGLKQLGLSGCNITDAALKSLLTMPGLQELDLSECPLITDAGVKALRAMQHNITVTYYSH